MREIKFRGQTRRKGERIINMAGDKCTSNWVYGGIFPQNESENGFAVIYQQKPEIKKYPVYADTVGQYTGTKDIKRKEIYEGDIVRNFLCIDDHGDRLYEQGVVKYDEETLGFSVFDDGNNRIKISYMGNIEVIGNVFDNPELIGQ